jgi:aminoglycoside phosphotransferase
MSLSATAWMAPDVVVPQRDALLDTAVVADRIGHLIGGSRRVRIDRCERLRVNYQIGKSLRVLHQVGAGGVNWTISARAFRQGGGRRAYEEASPWAVPIDGVESVFYDERIETVFWVFPNDRKIPGLAAVAAAVVPPVDGVPAAWRATQLAAYAPEKSATLACLDDARTVIAYAKVSAQNQDAGGFERYQALFQAVAGSSCLRVPRPLAHVPSCGLLLLEAIDGRRMDDPAVCRRAEEDAAALGMALAEFHGLAPVHAPAFTRFLPDRLREAQRLLACVRPDVEETTNTLVRALISTRQDTADAPVCLHGDVHPKNAIVTDRGIALIDVEDLAIGPAAADLGSFLAALRYLHCGGRLDRHSHDAIARAFLAGYQTSRRLPARDELAWHTAAALLIERIFRAVSRVRPLGLIHLPRLVDAARELLMETRQ